MNDDVLKHIIRWCRVQMDRCESGLTIHDGEKEDAIATYRAVIQMLTEMREKIQ